MILNTSSLPVLILLPISGKFNAGCGQVGQTMDRDPAGGLR